MLSPTTRGVILVILYLLAAPTYAVVWLLKVIKILRGFARVKAGRIECPHCAAINVLDRLAMCKRCGVTEFGSRLFCTNCKQVTRSFPCDRCTATIRVL